MQFDVMPFAAAPSVCVCVLCVSECVHTLVCVCALVDACDCVVCGTQLVWQN